MSTEPGQLHHALLPTIQELPFQVVVSDGLEQSIEVDILLGSPLEADDRSAIEMKLGAWTKEDGVGPTDSASYRVDVTEGEDIGSIVKIQGIPGELEPLARLLSRLAEVVNLLDADILAIAVRPIDAA